MADFLISRGENATVTSSQHCDHITPQQAVLYPPSYFKDTCTSVHTEPDEYEPTASSAAAASPASTYVVSYGDGTRLQQHGDMSNREQEIATLKLQNEALRLYIHT